MQIWRSSVYLMGLVGLCLLSAPESRAEEPSPSDKGAIVEGAGFTLYDMESIKGSNFGTKECFHGVAFSAAGPAKIEYKFVNESTIEATVPDVKAGMSFIDVVAGGGNARSKGFLVQAK